MTLIEGLPTGRFTNCNESLATLKSLKQNLVMQTHSLVQVLGFVFKGGKLCLRNPNLR
jgi:hypothetical protein